MRARYGRDIGRDMGPDEGEMGGEMRSEMGRDMGRDMGRVVPVDDSSRVAMRKRAEDALGHGLFSWQCMK